MDTSGLRIIPLGAFFQVVNPILGFSASTRATIISAAVCPEIAQCNLFEQLQKTSLSPRYQLRNQHYIANKYQLSSDKNDVHCYEYHEYEPIAPRNNLCRIAFVDFLIARRSWQNP